MRKQYRIVLSAAVVAVSLLVAGRAMAGSLDPPNPPGPTMHTLEEIYQKQAVTTYMIDNVTAQLMYNEDQVRNVQVTTSTMLNMLGVVLSPQTLSSTTAVVNAGYYAATTLTAVDAYLAAENIKTNVTIFGITGTYAGGGIVYTNATAGVPTTGQTTSYQTGDDGDYRKGVTWPDPRFTIQADTNCVTDNLTGLVWARNANLNGAMTWSSAIVYCEGLIYGGQSDWRLPNVKELQSLIDFGQDSPALPSGHPFAGVLSDSYWSSTTSYADGPDYAWCVSLLTGDLYRGNKAPAWYAWPVRGGQ